ncbi:MAG: NUDIX domain-containing protein [Proteobacteria bacterium]|nr:NUDIX domain-containing protein [Pseudomonadota bacterium]
MIDIRQKTIRIWNQRSFKSRSCDRPDQRGAIPTSKTPPLETTQALFLNQRKPFQFQSESIPSWFGQASVLILFWEEENSIKVVLTKRSANLSNHKGEVCFPGGKLEEGEAFVEAALREAEEEIGIDRDRVEITGRLDDAWSGAAFRPTCCWRP